MNSIIYIDVDGVLNFDEKCEGFFDYIVSLDQEYPIRVNPAHGQWLLKLAEDTGAELRWGTSWQGLANTHIGPNIGLPELPYADLGLRKFSQSMSDWKVRGVEEDAGDRPFVWFDDDFIIEMMINNSEFSNGRVIPVDGRVGLRRSHITAAEFFLSLLK